MRARIEGPGRRPAAAALTVLAICAGCGGGARLDASALSQRADALRSQAAEGALLADDAAAGRTTGAFVRGHADDLEAAASELGTSLEGASVADRLEPARRRLAALADRVRADLARLDGASQAGRRRVARRLDDAAATAGRIAARLG